jgi:hypothetical protein
MHGGKYWLRQEQEGFEVFLTGDKNMPNQQQLAARSFAVLIMSAINWPPRPLLLHNRVRSL